LKRQKDALEARVARLNKLKSLTSSIQQRRKLVAKKRKINEVSGTMNKQTLEKINRVDKELYRTFISKSQEKKIHDGCVDSEEKQMSKKAILEREYRQFRSKKNLFKRPHTNLIQKSERDFNKIIDTKGAHKSKRPPRDYARNKGLIKNSIARSVSSTLYPNQK
jgi:hypothetical protein